MRRLSTLFALLLLYSGLTSAEKPVIYLQPNTTQIFTELYQAYGLLHPPARTFFEDALYLDQSTQPSILPLQPANQAIFAHADEVLSQYHKRLGDIELYIDPARPKPFFYTSVGSKQLIVALVYAITMTEPDKKFLFVEQAPFYSGHPNAVTGIFRYPNARFLAFHDPDEVHPEPGEIVVEFVTSPNNPDGKFRQPLTNASILIADFVFASTAFGQDGSGYIEKNIEWLKEARAAGKHIFSFNSASKQFGKTGARCGYLWYPIYDDYAKAIFPKFFNYISASTVASGTTGLEQFLDLIKAFLDLPDAGLSLRQDGNKSLIHRHELVAKELLLRYPGTTIISLPGSPTLFAKIADPRIPAKKASDLLFDDLKTVVNNGEPMGENNDYIRLNLSGYSSILLEFLHRLAGQQKYTLQDLLITTTRTCLHRQITANSTPNTLYVADINDCAINADAALGPIEIILPPFIDYLDGPIITITKIDASPHTVLIKSNHFTATLSKPNDTHKVQWSQPFYQNGRWAILSPH